MEELLQAAERWGVLTGPSWLQLLRGLHPRACLGFEGWDESQELGRSLCLPASKCQRRQEEVDLSQDYHLLPFVLCHLDDSGFEMAVSAITTVRERLV